MTILVDWQINDLIKETNLITPYDPSLLNPASLDVLLGDEIIVENDIHYGWKKVSLDKKDGILIMPNTFLLASTKEVFNLPDNISCEFRLKSSRAREGWGHALAVWIDPGFNNSVLTLELKNYTRFKKLHLFAGMKIGQIIFHEHEYCDKSYRETGRYNNDKTVMESKG